MLKYVCRSSFQMANSYLGCRCLCVIAITRALAYRLRNRPELTGVDRDDYPHVGGYRTGEAAAVDLTAAPELDDDPGGATLRRLLRVAVRRGADLATVHS